MSVSLDQLNQRIIRELWEGTYPLIETTTGAGSATSVVVGHAAYSSASSNAYDGIWIYGPSVSSAPKSARVTRGGFDGSTGTFTVSPAMGAAIGDSASAYFLRGLHMDELVEAINNILKNLYLDRYMVLSESEDASMEDSGTSAYTAINGAALSKDTTTANVLTGTQSLLVSTNAADEGAETTSLQKSGDSSIDADPTERYLISVVFRISAGSWKFDLVDQDANTIRSIAVTEAEGDEKWLETRFEEAVESGDTGLRVRVINTSGGGSDAIYIDSISILPRGKHVYLLPSQIEDPEYIEEILYMPQGPSTEIDDVYLPLYKELKVWSQVDHLRDFAGVHQKRIQFARAPTAPIWLRFKAKGSALTQNTGDSNTTEAPEEIIFQGAVAQLAGRLKARFPFGTDGYAKYATKEAEAMTVYQTLLDDKGYLRPQAVLKAQHRESA